MLGRVLLACGILLAAAGAAGLIWSYTNAPPALVAGTEEGDSPPPGRGDAPSSSPSPAGPAPSGETPDRPDSPAPDASASPPPAPDESTPPAPAPDESASATPAPDSSAKPFTGSYDHPDTFTYRLDDPGTPAPDAPAFHRVVRVEARRAENPASGAASDALLIALENVPDREFTVIALVETESPPASGKPADLGGVQWRLSYSGGQFVKSAFRVASGTETAVSADAFNARHQGFDDRAEVEFYGPPDTRYYAVLLTDGEYATLIVP